VVIDDVSSTRFGHGRRDGGAPNERIHQRFSNLQLAIKEVKTAFFSYSFHTRKKITHGGSIELYKVALFMFM